MTVDPTPIGETGLPADVRQLSIEQSPIRAITVGAFRFSRAAASSEKGSTFCDSNGAISFESFETLIASSESSSLAASSPAEAAV